MLKKCAFDIDADLRNEVESVPLPYESVGWPPGVALFIRQVAYEAARTVLANIYSEKELEDKAENILLGTSTDSIK